MWFSRIWCKANTEICVGDNKSITSWYVNELNFESDYVNNYINDICSYESKVAELEFDAWPDMGLGLLIPKCQSGKFMFAVDYGPNAIISIEEISLQEVISYTRSLVNYGYNAGKSTTNESEQYIYVTYNNDDILIKISYTPSFSRFTIRIIQSTKEEINKELGKL